MAGWGKADNKTASGTIELAADGAVTGTSTAFTTEAAVGDVLTANSIDFRITAIASDTACTVVDADTAGATIVAQSAGASYALSEKPSLVGNSVGGYTSENIHGVDTNEMAANKTQEGAAHTGWNHVRTVGSRKIVETLVAMSKNGITGDAEDVVFEDYLIAIATQPAAASVTSPADAEFTVAATITGSGGTLAYQWQVSTDSGSTWANTVDASGTAATLTVTSTDAEYVDANEFRCVVSATGADSVTSNAVAVTIA